MDMDEKNKFGMEKRNEDPMNYNSPSISSDWRFASANLPNSSMGLISTGNPVAVCNGDLIGSSSCSSASMVDTFGPILWDHPTNSQNLGFNDINVQNSASTSSTMGIRKGSLVSLRSGMDRSLDMGWNQPSSLLKGGIFLPNTTALLPQTLSQFPADSGFIERAARFSSFNDRNFSDMVNPFVGGMIQGPQGDFMDTGFNSVSGGQSQKNELNVGTASKDVSMPLEHETTEGSPLKNERSESLVRYHEDSKGVGGSGNESDEAELSGSGGGGQDDRSMLEGRGMEPSPSGAYLKKRKRGGQNKEHDQAKNVPDQPSGDPKNNMDIQQKGDQNPTSATNKTTGKHGRNGSQASDPSKEEYIHIRARRGQATNSHSLAERVRREKISERMKFLQDLVPGCSKVTGKAVMLDEIINYVQSLQRQVEFLSMKLATVNPRLDFNIEGLLAKDILQSRAGPSSTLGFLPEMPMTFPPSLSSQPGIIQSGLPGMRASSDILRRTINSQLTTMTAGFKEVSQVLNVWDDELHNVVQMNFGTSDPPNTQDVNGTTQ